MDTKPLVYVIEDTPEMADLISIYLEKENMAVKKFATAEDGLECLKTGALPELVILDLNLPGMSGFEFLEKFRGDFKPTVPVIIVSARDADEDIIRGLGFGADEFVTKPFSPRVLVARVKANLRRQAVSASAAEQSICFGDYTLLLNSCVLKKGTVKVPLSVKEYAVLEYLALNAGKSLTPEEIYSHVWKTCFGDMTAVAVYVQRLRKKIESDPSSPEYIKTEFGRGYQFDKGKIHP